MIQQDEKKKAIGGSIGAYILGVFLVIIFSVVVPEAEGNVSATIYVTFLINTLFSLVKIMKSDRPYSFVNMHWIFFFFFFCFAGLIQSMLGNFPWGLFPEENEIIKANIYLLIWGCAFSIGCYFGNQSEIKKAERTPLTLRKSNTIFFVFVALYILLYKVATTGVSNLFARGTNTLDLGGADSSIRLIISHSMNAFLAFFAAFTLLNCKMNGVKRNTLYAVIASSCLILVCFPTGISRYNAAAIYFGLMLLIFSERFKGNTFTYLFIAAFMILFPAFDVFRRTSFTDVNFFEVIINTFKDMAESYATGHYDAYSMFIQTLRYVKENGIEWGYQFVGNILFFVPRTLWEDKPIGTGATIMEGLGANFTNVSAPLPAEMYMNFGLVGLVLGGILVGMFLSYLDKRFWSEDSLRREKKYGRLDIFYPFGLIFFFFIMRGDLLSSLSYTIAYITMVILMYKALKNRKDIL